MSQPIKLYGFALSGHAHRAELMLSLLELPYTVVTIDLLKGEQRSAAFLAMNPFGQVPVIDDGGDIVADSNAILVYLAQRYGKGAWLPSDPLGAARVQRWLSIAAGPLASGPARARLINLFGAPFDPALTIAQSHALLQQMEVALTADDYLAGAEPSIADIACYSYTQLAPEGNVALTAYPKLQQWLARVEALPGFLPMPASPVGLRALNAA